MVSAGRILILPQGTWDNATMYNMLDLVAYNGISWLCKRQCVGITPSVTATEYWQQFGSSAPIASTTVAGLVMPDGQTITINTTTGAIAVPTATAAALGLVKVDGTSITIDANGVISSAGGNLSNLGDVAITSLQTGQVLIWNQTNQKWQNGTIAGALSQLSDVLINSASEGQILVYDNTAGKWKNATAESTLSSSTKPIQTKVVKDMASDVIETLSAGASQAYSAGDLIMCSNGKWYKAITDISQNQTLTAGGNVEETSQRALNTNLTQSLNGFMFDEDSQTGKGKYSMDGGSTWQNFSSGGILEEVVASTGRFFPSERAGDYAEIASRRFTKPNNNKTYLGYSRIGSSYGWWTAGTAQADVTNDNSWGGVMDYTMPSGNHIFVNGIVNGAYGNPAAYPTSIVLNGVTVATFNSTGGWSMYYTNTYWNDESFSTLMILEALLYS